MTARITEELGAFASGLQYQSLPEAAVEVARMGIADLVSVMFAGADEPIFRAALDQISHSGGPGDARIVFGARTAKSQDAALVNGAAGHVLAFDDTGLAGHPSAVLVPAVLAECEAVNADGRTAVAAYVAGYEIWAALLAREPEPYELRGWHSTALIGGVAAAAAAARVRGLDAAAAANAIAIAASFVGGVTANFQTQTKVLQVARASAAGVLAARLAAAGMGGRDTALEHPTGLLKAMSPNGKVDLERDVPLPPRVWRIAESGLDLKKYPMCLGALRAIDAAVALRNAEKLTPEDVRHVTFVTNDAQAAMLRFHDPKLPIEACFSIEFAMAASLISGDIGRRQLTTDFLVRPDVQALMKRVGTETRPSRSADDPRFAEFDQVRIELRDGRLLRSEEVRFPSGHHRNPMSVEDRWAKFKNCTSNAMSETQAERFFSTIVSIETASSIRDISVA